VEIRDLQRAIDLLRCSINEKEFAMKIAQTRLDERTRRLCVEVCFDEPMKGFVSLLVCVCATTSACLSPYSAACLRVYLVELPYFQICVITEGRNLGGRVGDHHPTFRVGDIATYIPPPTIPKVSGDVVVKVG